MLEVMFEYGYQKVGKNYIYWLDRDIYMLSSYFLWHNSIRALAYAVGSSSEH